MNQPRSLLNRTRSSVRTFTWGLWTRRVAADDPAFEDEGRSQARRGARTICLIAAVLFVAGGVANYWTQQVAMDDLIRVRSWCLLGLGGILLLLETVAGNRGRELALLAVTIIAVAIEELALYTGKAASDYHHVLGFLILGAATLMTWSPVWSFAVSLMVGGVYLRSTLLFGPDLRSSVFVEHIMIVVTAGIVAVVITAMREGSRLRDFYTRQSLANARRALAEREYRYRSLVETASSAIVVLAPDRRVVEFNHAAELIHGWKRGEAFGKDYCELFLPQTVWRAAAEKIDEVVAGATVKGLQAPVVGRDGEQRIMLWNLSCLRDAEGRALGIIAVGQDITEIRRAGQALRASEERFRTIFEHAPVMINSFDAAGHCVLWNRECERTMNWTREEVQACEDPLSLFYPDPAVRDEVLVRIRAGRGEFTEWTVRARDGSTRSQLWANFALPDGSMIGVGHDITERKRAEEALRNSEQRYRAIIEDQTEFICRWLPDGELTFVNEAYCRYFGRSPDEVITGQLRPRIHQEDLPVLRASLAALGQGNAVSVDECRVVAPAGDIRWHQWTSRAITDGRGRVREIQSVGRDITERKRAEEAFQRLNAELDALVAQRTAALRESEDRFRTMFETSPIGMVIGDLNGLRVVNPAFGKLIGYTNDELTGKSTIDFTHPDDREKSLALYAALREGTTDQGEQEKRYIRPDGTTVWAKSSVAVSRDEQGQVRYAFGIVQDHTRQKRDGALQRGEREALDVLGHGGSLDAALTRMIGHLEEYAPELFCSVLVVDETGTCLRHAAAPRLPEEYNRAVDGLAIGPRAGSCGTAAYRNDRVIVEDIAADPLWVDFRELALRHGLRACWSQPIVSADRLLLGTFAIYYIQPRQPTDSEIHLIELAAHVAGIVIQRDRHSGLLRRQQIEMAHGGRLSLAGELASGLAHELHQPLEAIVNYAGACVRKARTGTVGTDDLLQPLAAMQEQALHAGEVVRRLKDFIGQRVADRRRVDLNELVRVAVKLAEPEARQQGITWRLDLSAGLPPVEADGIQIQQVLLNLITNGLEAMAGTGASSKELAIESSVRPDGGVEIAVHDRGHGLVPEVRRRVFEPFYTTKKAGLGLGLAISATIVESHGGKLLADSNPHGGATFRLRLPAADLGSSRADQSGEERCADEAHATTTPAGPMAPASSIE